MENARAKKYAINLSAALIIIILALIPFHAFLTVYLSSLIGHYTALRLWKEVLLAIILLCSAFIALTDKKLAKVLINSWLIRLILTFFVIELVWGLIAHYSGGDNTKALLYGWLSDCRYLLFFILCFIAAKKTSMLKNKSVKLVLYPALIVILFGLLEVFVLPRGFLSHFGYGPNTISPYQTINHNLHYVRIISTLRGADPLGAYLLIPLSLAVVLLVRGKKTWQLALFTAGSLIVLIFSYARSAWLGLIVSVAFAIYFGVKSKILKRNLIYIGLALIILLAGIFVLERNNSRVQNIVFHSQKNSAIKTTSDEGHSSSIKSGIKDIAKDPLGKGPGTSGPASVYNQKISRIPENYYIQIGQELGVIGLAVYIAISVLVVMSLWARREDTLALALLASFLGLIVVNMLLEAWTDDTLCYLWWGMAGIAIATPPKRIDIII
jgi:hypothetical protein